MIPYLDAFSNIDTEFHNEVNMLPDHPVSQLLDLASDIVNGISSIFMKDKKVKDGTTLCGTYDVSDYKKGEGSTVMPQKETGGSNPKLTIPVKADLVSTRESQNGSSVEYLC